MGIIVRRWILLVPLVALATGMTSCAERTDGSPVSNGNPAGSQSTTGSSATTSERTTSSRPTSGDSPVADTDPCSMLTTSAKSQLGLTGNGEDDDVGSARGCRWSQRGSQETTFLGIYIHDSLGIKDVPSGGNVKQLSKIGEHEAVQLSEAGGPGGCSVVMGVTEKSRVTTTVLAGTDTQKACELALQMAGLVEPELP